MLDKIRIHSDKKHVHTHSPMREKGKAPHSRIPAAECRRTEKLESHHYHHQSSADGRKPCERLVRIKTPV